MTVLFFIIIIAPFLNIQEVKADGLNKEDYMIYENYYSVDYSGYKYPVLPGMSNWPYGNHQKMIDICQIPDDVLDNMTTEELLETVLYYPLFADIYAYDNTDVGYGIIKEHFYGLLDLSMRDDRLVALYNFLNSNKNITGITDADYSGIGQNGTYNSFMFLEVLKSTSDFLGERDNYLSESVQSGNPLSFAGRIELIYLGDCDVTTSKNVTMEGVEYTVAELWNYSDGNTGWRFFNDLSATVKSYINSLFVGVYGISPSSAATVKYNCHSYAWGNNQTNPFGWVNMFIATGYTAVGMQNANVGGKLVYNNTYRNNINSLLEYSHSAIIQSKIYHQYHINTVSGFVLKSKWGMAGLYSHTMENCPYFYYEDTSYVCDRLYYNE